MNVFELSGAKSHTQFFKFLEDLVSDKEGREKYYDEIKSAGLDEDDDYFRAYFEEFNAEKKSNKQDYTPGELAGLMAELADPTAHTVYDGAAGSGTLVLAQWVSAGKPKDFQAIAWDFADNVIPYLIHNLASRNIKAGVTHGDTLTGEVFRRFILTPGANYSEVELCSAG